MVQEFVDCQKRLGLSEAEDTRPEDRMSLWLRRDLEEDQSTAE